MQSIRTVPLLAGAYVGRRLERCKPRTHSALIAVDGYTVIRLLCGKANQDSVCDSATWTNTEPTCERCKIRLARLRGKNT